MRAVGSAAQDPVLKWTSIVAAVLVGIVAIACVVGLFVPRDHVARSRARYGSSPEEIWAVVTDHAAAPEWRPGIASVERAPDRDGHAVWVERSRFGPMPLEVVESVPPRRYVLRIAGEDLPFGGTWTYEIEPAEGGATLTITERGTVMGSFFRTVARFFTGYHGTMDACLRALG